jgi:hypothetical protein
VADQGQEQQEQEQSLSDVVLDLEFEQKLVRTYHSSLIGGGVVREWLPSCYLPTGSSPLDDMGSLSMRRSR